MFVIPCLRKYLEEIFEKEQTELLAIFKNSRFLQMKKVEILLTNTQPRSNVSIIVK